MFTKEPSRRKCFFWGCQASAYSLLSDEAGNSKIKERLGAAASTHLKRAPQTSRVGLDHVNQRPDDSLPAAFCTSVGRHNLGHSRKSETRKRKAHELDPSCLHMFDESSTTSSKQKLPDIQVSILSPPPSLPPYFFLSCSLLSNSRFSIHTWCTRLQAKVP